MSKRSISTIVLTVSLVVGLFSPVFAQVNPFDGSLALSKSDIAMIKSAAREGLDNQPDGSVVEWANEETGNAGSATLLRSFTYEGQACREVQHLIDPKGEAYVQRYVFTLCKQPDGSWKS